MKIQEAYNNWAEQYDSNKNRTRDLEAISLQNTLQNIPFETCLEIGCGTGKNTEWLIQKAQEVVAVDFSEGMLAVAQEKINSDKVEFHHGDITKKWNFATKQFDLVTFSLVLEHIENLSDIFKKAADFVVTGGIVYVGELHPFKQYQGTKARFESDNGQQVLTCFSHHISDFTQAAKQNGFQIAEINEYFDDDNRNALPRILTLLLKKR
ncbi:methyltransferase domain-containing protein [Maribellus comscasis]|uniref:Methyltransferase domain-containing protein n=1 Tax=Maribellus comscasis TaxID=2681766 RepID=A0A6I6JP20_9BACT|nr:class I SAM-dependent methyltransferase [Maribellus comscasis]QGY44201.1 methyltransferase domain-containing protein [Maribellus comscasis]